MMGKTVHASGSAATIALTQCQHILPHITLPKHVLLNFPVYKKSLIYCTVITHPTFFR
jgi:hypothetical protein